MKRIIFIFFIVASFIANAEAPKWVKQRPVDQRYFVGVAYSSTKEDNYTDAAKKRALADLASEISTTIEVTSFLKQTSTTKSIDYKLEENIKSKTQKKIQDFEAVDSYEADGKYWVYYRLSRVQYYENLKQTVEKAIREADELMAKARNFKDEDKYYLAIQHNLMASALTFEYIGETHFPELVAKIGNQTNKAFTEISSILTHFKIKAKKVAISMKIGETKEIPLLATVSYEADGKITIPDNFPINFNFSKGKGKFSSNTAITDAEGIAKTTLFSLSSNEKKQIIEAKPDIEYMLKDFQNQIVYEKSLKNLAVNKGLYNADLQINTAYISSNEKSFGKSNNIKVLEQQLKAFFQNYGFVFTDKEKDANYIIKIDADTKDGGEMDLRSKIMKIVLLEVNVSVIDNKKNEEMFSKSVQNIKGVKPTNETASQAAYKSADASFKKELYPELKKTLGLE